MSVKAPGVAPCKDVKGDCHAPDVKSKGAVMASTPAMTTDEVKAQIEAIFSTKTWGSSGDTRTLADVDAAKALGASLLFGEVHPRPPSFRPELTYGRLLGTAVCGDGDVGRVSSGRGPGLDAL
jgi:hypothetical protein